MKHPAKFSKELLPLLAELVGDRSPALDPMAGVGTIAKVIPDILLNELEPEWAKEARKMARYPWRVTTEDARHLSWADDTFGAVVTSPTYGNRMADHHDAKDACKRCDGNGYLIFIEAPDVDCPVCSGTGLSRRNTYTHTIGRNLTTGNTGAMQWGAEYKSTHLAIWAEVYRVLAPGGRFVLNVKDHIRKGELVPVSAWHRSACQAMGFVLEDRHMVECPGNRQGANGTARIPYENVYVFTKPSKG